MSAASPRPGRGQRIGFWLAVALALAALGGCAAVYAESETARQDWRRERAELRNRIVFPRPRSSPAERRPEGDATARPGWERVGR